MKQFCEIVVNLDQWFRRCCRLKIFLMCISGSHFVQRSLAALEILLRVNKDMHRRHKQTRFYKSGDEHFNALSSSEKIHFKKISRRQKYENITHHVNATSTYLGQ